MDLATQAHLTTLRDLLAYRQRELRAEVHAAESARSESLAPQAHEVVDRKDEAARYGESGLAGAQEQRDRDELAQVDAALHRLDRGSYGDCVDCGEPVALQRLLVQPAAERCAACQSAIEHARAR